MADHNASFEQRIGKLEGDVVEILNLLKTMWEQNAKGGTSGNNEEVPPPQDDGDGKKKVVVVTSDGHHNDETPQA